MPVEYLLVKIFDFKSFKKCLFISALLVLLIELIQFVTHTGVFDIDDIILNLIGMSLMYGIVFRK